MTKEEKQLLLVDLCARLPFGVRVKSSRRRMPVTLSLDVMTDFRLGCSIKPYLRPMSSMTEEEEKEFKKIVYDSMNIDNISSSVYVADWLYSKHLDVHGLIPKGLAIEVTEENNPYKE